MAARRTGLAFVDAPSGMAGFLLLVHIGDPRSENERRAGGRWTVSVPVEDAAAVRTLLARVQSWLRQERIPETRVAVDDDVYRVSIGRADIQRRTEGGRWA
jgi:hypothetical protein